jgi:hypothetical protein
VGDTAFGVDPFRTALNDPRSGLPEFAVAGTGWTGAHSCRAGVVRAFIPPTHCKSARRVAIEEVRVAPTCDDVRVTRGDSRWEPERPSTGELHTRSADYGREIGPKWRVRVWEGTELVLPKGRANFGHNANYSSTITGCSSMLRRSERTTPFYVGCGDGCLSFDLAYRGLNVIASILMLRASSVRDQNQRASGRTEFLHGDLFTLNVQPASFDVPSGTSGWSGDVEVAAKRFADHVARGRVIVGGSFFDSSTEGGVESEKHRQGRPLAVGGRDVAV